MNRIQPPADRDLAPLFAEEEKFQFDRYWKIIRPRLHIVIFIALFVVVGAYIKVSSGVTMYHADGLIMIEPEDNVISLDRFSFQDWRNEYFNSQILILRSRTLMKNVQEELSTAGGTAGGTLSIEPVEETRMVRVSYRSPDPQTAADMVNTIFDKFVEFNLDIKTRASMEASEFITKQIRTLQFNLSEKERELQKYGKKKELYYLSSRESTIVDKFADLNKAYTQAQIDRINKESVYKELNGLRYEDYPQVKQSSLIDNLKNSYSKLEGDYQKKGEIFRESYPQMEQLRSQMTALQNRIDQETRNLGDKIFKEARNDYQTAKKKEESLLKLLNQQKGVVESSNADAIYYNSLNIEVTNMRMLLDHMVRKQKEFLLSSRLEGLQTSNIKVIDRAEVPRAPLPSGKTRVLLMALMGGLALGVGLVIVVDLLDRTIKEPAQVKALLGIPALGIIAAPGSKQGRYKYYAGYGKKKNPDKQSNPKSEKIELVNFIDPDCSHAESYRNIRTSIMLSTPKHAPRVMAITSAVPSEGKTSTTANLGVAFAQLGKKIMLVDGDLRKPRLHKIFNLKNARGLSSVLVGGAAIKDVVQKTRIPNLSVIPSGPIPPNPVELLDSEEMAAVSRQLQETADFVFFDSPPLIGIMDAILLGKVASGVIMVTWGGKTHQNEVIKAKEELDQFHIRVLGLVLNRLDFKKEGYGYRYAQKHAYRYKYREDLEI